MAAPSDNLAGLWASIVRGWDRFWFAPMDPTTLACVRILAGVLTLYVHVCYCWDLNGYVGRDAWIDADLAKYFREDVEIWRYGFQWDDAQAQFDRGNYYWSVYHHINDPWAVTVVHGLILVSMALFTVGLWTRYTGLLTWMGAMCYVQRATSTVYGVDTMMMITLLYLQFGPAGAALSVDRWLAERAARQRGLRPPPVEPSAAANFACRMIQFHFAFIYFASGTSKLLGSTWWAGTSLNYVILNPAFAPMDAGWYYGLMASLAANRWVWELVVSASIIGTLLLEVGLIFVVWDRRWTWLLVAGGAGMHTGIGLLMGLSTFSLMMFVMLVSFIPPEVLRAAIAGVMAWAGRPKAEASKKQPQLSSSVA